MSPSLFGLPTDFAAMDPQQPPSNRAGSTFVKCVGCEKLVRLPSDPDPNAIVKCPRCEETYPIGVLLDAEIPELEIVEIESSQPAQEIPKINIETDEQNRFIVAPALAKGAKRPQRRRSTTTSTNGHVVSESDYVGDNKRSERSPRKPRQSKKKPPGSRGEVFKIVLGALMAPPVAQLVIWWGLQLDPLKLGPIVAKVVPVIVPLNFHGEQEEGTEKDSKEGESTSSDSELDSSGERPALPSDDQSTTDRQGWSS